MIIQNIPIKEIISTEETRPLNRSIPNDKFDHIHVSISWKGGIYTLYVIPLPADESSIRTGLCISTPLYRAEQQSNDELKYACRVARSRISEALNVLTETYGVHFEMPNKFFPNID